MIQCIQKSNDMQDIIYNILHYSVVTVCTKISARFLFTVYEKDTTELNYCTCGRLYYYSQHDSTYSKIILYYTTRTHCITYYSVPFLNLKTYHAITNNIR